MQSLYGEYFTALASAPIEHDDRVPDKASYVADDDFTPLNLGALNHYQTPAFTIKAQEDD